MKMLPTYQITSFIDLKNLDTAFDGTKPTVTLAGAVGGSAAGQAQPLYRCVP